MISALDGNCKCLTGFHFGTEDDPYGSCHVGAILEMMNLLNDSLEIANFLPLFWESSYLSKILCKSLNWGTFAQKQENLIPVPGYYEVRIGLAKSKEVYEDERIHNTSTFSSRQLCDSMLQHLESTS